MSSRAVTREVQCIVLRVQGLVKMSLPLRAGKMSLWAVPRKVQGTCKMSLRVVPHITVCTP